MSRSQRNRNRSRATNSDDDDSNDMSQLSQSSRRGNRRNSPSTQHTEDYAPYTVATVKFILNHLASKLPLKRADLVKECCNGNGKIFATISAPVADTLKSIYGIILHELPAAKGGNKQYICYAEKPSPSAIKLKTVDRQQQSLLMLVLTYIFIKGGPVGEEVLCNYLASLDIDVHREHDFFGDVKQCLETFRKQLYIKREKKASEASNEEKITIEWGERALMEFDKKVMLVEVAEMFHKPTSFFKKQYMELMTGAENIEEES